MIMSTPPPDCWHGPPTFALPHHCGYQVPDHWAYEGGSNMVVIFAVKYTADTVVADTFGSSL